MEYQKANIKEYGYTDHKFLKTLWKIASSLVVLLVIVVMYLSIVVIFIQSFNASESVSEFTHFTFKWYGKIISSKSLWNSIVNTFAISLGATVISTIVGTLIAIGIFCLNKKRQRNLLLLNNIPLLNADIVTGISLMLVFSLVIKIFPHFFGWKSLLIAHVYFTLPYVILSVLPKLKEMDPNLFDASQDLGVKPHRALVKVIIPAIKSGIFSGLILAFTMSFDDFVISYYTTGNGFDTLPIWIYSSIGRKSLTPAVYAFSSLFTLGSIGVILIANFLKRGKKNEKK
jgi:spermidine/putrescine transport system permease protein